MIENAAENIVLKSIGGFYYVKTPSGVTECKAKGKFRKLSLSPVAGDIVDLSREEDTVVISNVRPRKNVFIRPPFANLDVMVIVISSVDPRPNLLLVDKMSAVCRDKGAECAIALTKGDIESVDYLKEIYSLAGFPVYNRLEKDDLDALKEFLKGKLCAFSGNSGVGKSTLLNRLFPGLGLATGETSKKLGRGRHTTRRVEIFPTDICMVADTPGFSFYELDDENFIPKENLQYAFREFSDYMGKCRFADCSHTAEVGCAVREAVESGKIAKTRYESYVTLYERQKQIKDWQKV